MPYVDEEVCLDGREYAIANLARLRIGDGVDEAVDFIAHVLGCDAGSRALELLFAFGTRGAEK